MKLEGHKSGVPSWQQLTVREHGHVYHSASSLGLFLLWPVPKRRIQMLGAPPWRAESGPGIKMSTSRVG